VIDRVIDEWVHTAQELLYDWGSCGKGVGAARHARKCGWLCSLLLWGEGCNFTRAQLPGGGARYFVVGLG
jgi:hypothetical protein